MLTYSLDGFSWQLGWEENGWAEARGTKREVSTEIQRRWYFSCVQNRMCVPMWHFYHPFQLKTENSNANAYASMEKPRTLRCR